MKSIGILYQPAMVRALLEDRKTQTRRGVGRLLGFGPITEFKRSDTKGYDWTFRDRRALWNDLEHARAMAACPYGVAGDRLWVRESGNIAVDGDAWMYADAGGILGPTAPPGSENWAREWKSCPSIHMPRWASRIELLITEVRLEQVRSITQADAIAEGATSRPNCCGSHLRQIGWSMDWSEVGRHSRWTRAPLNERDVALGSAVSAYGNLWNKINGEGSWQSNPWVWVISFERVRS